LHVAVVQGDAAAITGSDNDISGRTVLASMDKSITAAAFNGIIDVDVTSLAQQAMSSANGWASNDALMFIVSVTGVTVPTGYTDPEFYINAQDNSGVAASITFKVESPIQTEFTPLVRDQLKAAVNGLVPNGGTPLSESYTEVARYLMGSSTYFGNGGSGHATSAPQSTVDEAGNTYSSPIAAANQSCAANSIIVMTDGVSNSDTETPTQTKSVTNSKVSCSSISDSGNSLNPDDYTCMAKLSGWLNVADKNTVNRQITTNMVGFYLDSSTLKQMQKVSDAGQGTTFAADDATSLLAAFQKIVSSVVDTNATMAAPGVAVNQLNRLQYLNQLYYAVFKPKNIGVWPGNLKKYALGGTAENPVVEDVNGKTATDPNTGFFLNTAKSYWSQEVDGQNVNAGGAKEVLDNSTVGRHLYVTTATGGIHGADPADRTVASTSLTKVTTWDAIPGEDLVPAGYTPALTDDQRKDVMDWLDTSWGDPLHSEPQLVNYGYTGGDYVAAANDPSLQKNAVFYSDNDGILHVVNAYNGKELMAFTPIEELHKAANRLNIEQQNPGAPVLSAPDYHRTTYGLDGTWVFWRRANTSDPSTVSSVYAYAGQRRGGRNYYALDVTSLDFSGAGNNTQNPSLLWQISPSSAAPFSLLGQTWSTPQLTKVSVNGKDVPVLVFAGGYDEAQDNNTVSSGDSMGNAIYMVNAFTGALVWYASNGAQLGTGSYGYSQNADMKWSMPAPPTVVDADGDGYADFIYAADMHGQVFRVDLDNFNNTGASGLVKDVVTLAKLGAGTTTNAADNRRFFAAPAVALSKRGDNTLLQVVIGSGYRAHPLAETTQEFVYGLDDVEALPTLQAIKNKQTVPGTTTLTSSDLADVTDPTATVTIDDVDTFGWKLGLDQSVGEKALSEAVILNNMAVFTTFTNESTQIDSCTSVAGGARLYIVNLGDGLTPDGMTSRSQSINVPGIPPAAQVLLTDLPSASDDGSDSDGGSGSGGDDESNSACGFQGSNMTALIGAMAVNLGQFNQCGLQRTGWYESTPTQVKQIFDNEGAVESTGDSQSP
jgi:type IV pilus assembly protein PilY1